MKKTTLIASFPSLPSLDFPYAEALAEEAGRRSRNAVLALAAPLTASVAAEGAKIAEEAQGGEALRLSLRPGSSLSARSVFLEAANARGPISELIILLEPGLAYRSLSESGPAEAEAFADERVKACFQILREAAVRSGKEAGFCTAFALPEAARQGSEKAALLGFGRLERDFLSSMAECRLAESRAERPVFALSGGFDSPEDFAASLFRLLDDPKAKGSGKWTRSGKGGFLGIF